MLCWSFLMMEGLLQKFDVMRIELCNDSIKGEWF